MTATDAPRPIGTLTPTVPASGAAPHLQRHERQQRRRLTMTPCPPAHTPPTPSAGTAGCPRCTHTTKINTKIKCQEARTRVPARHPRLVSWYGVHCKRYATRRTRHMPRHGPVSTCRQRVGNSQQEASNVVIGYTPVPAPHRREVKVAADQVELGRRHTTANGGKHTHTHTQQTGPESPPPEATSTTHTRYPRGSAVPAPSSPRTPPAVGILETSLRLA